MARTSLALGKGESWAQSEDRRTCKIDSAPVLQSGVGRIVVVVEKWIQYAHVLGVRFVPVQGGEVLSLSQLLVQTPVDLTQGRNGVYRAAKSIQSVTAPITMTMLRVAAVTGSDKSPPMADTNGRWSLHRTTLGEIDYLGETQHPRWWWYPPCWENPSTSRARHAHKTLWEWKHKQWQLSNTARESVDAYSCSPASLAPR